MKFLTINGKTDDGRVVIGGIYQFCSTTGLSLSDAIRFLRKRDFIVDLDEFSRDAIKDNWNPKTVVSRIEESLKDAELHG
jgi:hypothetical protein